MNYDIKKIMNSVSVMAILASSALCVNAEDTTSSTSEDLVIRIPKKLASLEWGLLMESDAVYAKSDGESESDFSVSTVEFSVEAEVSENISFSTLLLWEEGIEGSDMLDEAYLTIRPYADSSYSFQVGRFYIPVGSFETVFLTDPLTQDLMDSQQDSVMLTYEQDNWNLQVGAFTGDSDDSDVDFYAAVSFSPIEQLEIGVYYLSDMMETGSQSELEWFDELAYDRQDAAGIFANLQLGPVAINAEYVSALDDYEINGEEYAPSTYSLETSVVFAEKWTAGVRYEGSEEAFSAGDEAYEPFYEDAYGAVLSYQMDEYISISGEYMYYDSFEDTPSSDVFTLRLAFEL